MGAAHSEFIEAARASGALTESESYVEGMIAVGLVNWKKARDSQAAGSGATRRSQEKCLRAKLERAVDPEDVFTDTLDKQWRAQQAAERETIGAYLRHAVNEPLTIERLDVVWNDGSAWEMPLIRAQADMFEDERAAFNKHHLTSSCF